MSEYAYFDLCFSEYCNLTCSYCRSSNEGMLRGPEEEEFCRATLDFLEHSRAAILKVSGYGEAALWPHLLPALKRVSAGFPVVQVMTNGTMPLPLLDGLCGAIENVAFCITLDGGTLETNQHRSHFNEDLQRRMFAWLDTVTKQERVVEINCVLTRHNIDQFFTFARWIQQRYGGVHRIMPFPFRQFAGIVARDLYPQPAQIERFAAGCHALYEECADVLPPSAYLQRMSEFMAGRRRYWPCWIDRANFGMGPHLRRLVCACSANDAMPSAAAQNILTGARPQPAPDGFMTPACRTCFNHYEIINLFLDDVCSAEDLARLPIFGSPGVQPLLQELKEELNRSARP